MKRPVEHAADDARRLWHGSFDGVLSTQSQAEPGYPFGSVVPFCLDQHARPLLLLSHLAQHCHNLDADPRCALTLFKRPAGDIQQGPRLTCIADCRAIHGKPSDGQADNRTDNGAHDLALDRYCRHFPKGRVYAEQLGFRLYRVEPRRWHYNGGFATARWLSADRIMTTLPFAPETEQALLDRLKSERRHWLFSQFDASGIEPPEAVGFDRWGLTLRGGERMLRLNAKMPLDGWGALIAAIDDDALHPWPKMC